MNTREIAAEYRLAHWAQIIRDRTGSGLSVRAFCKEAGCHENAYYYWQRKLREVACDQLSVQGFAQVNLVTEPTQLALPEVSERGQLFAQIGGVHITADSAYPTDKLAALLRELSRPC